MPPPLLPPTFHLPAPRSTFAPMWDLFRMSSDKVALCHLELMRKMNDLIRDINKYGEEQVKVHRKVLEHLCRASALNSVH